MLLAAGGDSPYAVLDKLVPGYYHRRTEQGDICASCCCNNTATEHLMAERLVIDDITHWARTYRVSPLDFSWDLRDFEKGTSVIHCPAPRTPARFSHAVA